MEGEGFTKMLDNWRSLEGVSDLVLAEDLCEEIQTTLGASAASLPASKRSMNGMLSGFLQK